MKRTPHSRHPPEVKAKALMLHSRKYTPVQIARILDVPRPTVAAWCHSDPELYRQKEAKRKRKYGGKCIDCGARTTYKTGGTAVRCKQCRNIYQSETKKWTRERVIEAIQRWNEIYGCPPLSTDWNSTIARQMGKPTPEGGPYPTTNTVQGQFSGWANAIEEAGFPRPSPKARGRPHRRYWTEERIIEALRRHSENGHGPLMTEWQYTAKDHPTAQWVVRTFGSWSKAIAAAGLELNPRSHGGKYPRVNRAPRKNPALTDERVDFVKRHMQANVLLVYIARLMWKSWDYPSEVALRHALSKKGVVQDPGWRYRFNRQLTQEEIEEGRAL